VKKPSAVGEAVFKPLWESALVGGFPSAASVSTDL